MNDIDLGESMVWRRLSCLESEDALLSLSLEFNHNYLLLEKKKLNNISNCFLRTLEVGPAADTSHV